MNVRIPAIVFTTGLALFAGTALQAQEKGTWLLKLGAHNVDPKSDNGSLAGGALDVTVASNARPSVMLEYFVGNNIGIEVLAAWPFRHDIELNGVPAGTVDHLPPTLSVQYHFNPEGKVSPFLGAGINYTLFFSEEPAGPIAGADLELDSSFGLAAHAGLDFRLNDKWSLGVDARWIDIDTDVSVNGANVGTVEIDPLAYGAYAQIRF
jgi:outer membrane protein